MLARVQDWGEQGPSTVVRHGQEDTLCASLHSSELTSLHHFGLKSCVGGRAGSGAAG